MGGADEEEQSQWTWAGPELVTVLEAARPGRRLRASTSQETTPSATLVFLILVGFTHQYNFRRISGS